MNEEKKHQILKKSTIGLKKKKEHLSGPAQMCFLSFSDQIRFYERENASK